MRISDWSSDVCSSDLQTLAEFIVELADAVLQARKPLFLDRDVDGVTQVRRRRAGPRAVDERVRAIATRLGDQIQVLREIVVRFGRKADDAIRRERKVRPRRSAERVVGKESWNRCKYRGCAYTKKK